MSDQRSTYDTRWYDVPVTCCSWCHFVQFDDDEGPNHAGWCDRDAAEASAAPEHGGPQRGSSVAGEGAR